jgi:carbamoyl-phosphate synthase large subunit
MPKRTDIKSILIIGAGPIIIGQACEFDYSGAQACKALREEGYRVILVNSNPATIMTDPDMADATYIEPITPEFVERVIAREKPDAILPTMGGQTALNTALALADSGVLKKYNVELIGAKQDAIKKAEDRELFRDAMTRIGLESPKSRMAHSMAEAMAAMEYVGLPTIIRPSFTLGGTGGGIAYNKQEFQEIVESALRASPTSSALIEESVLGWKEFEMEVVRDVADNAIIICSIENIDPMGIHTGDSMTVAPALTLTDKEYQIMRNASIAVLREIGIETGGSNVQFAVNPQNGRMVVIEMNPRVSRSSALASKATGFPIARIAAKLAVGYTLDELQNDITGTTPAAFEPTIDYVVTKIPRFAFEKFPNANNTLTTSMKSVGEVMAIGRSFAESLQKGLRGLETGLAGLDEIAIHNAEDGANRAAISAALSSPTPDRLLKIAQAFRYGWSVDEVYERCFVDKWFLQQIFDLVQTENAIRKHGLDLDAPTLARLKRLGFSDARLAKLSGMTEDKIRTARQKLGVVPMFKRIDTCAAEFASQTSYMYSTYEGNGYGQAHCEAGVSNANKVIILGGGPNRIGQGIEFDYCCVHAAYALREAGIETVMVNCNPETVSTDYDTSDRLYFEPLTAEDVIAIAHKEMQSGKLLGVIVQYGGQTPLRLADALQAAGIPILGTSADAIDLAEDRERFQQLMQKLGFKQPVNGTASNLQEAEKVAERVGFPLVIRPSYVLGGRAMEIVEDIAGIRRYMERAVAVSGKNPVLLDSFLRDAIEIDVDVICDGTDTYVAGVMEHIEEAGIHSGDSACSLPPYSLDAETIAELEAQASKMALALGVVGLMNMQFAIQGNDIYILEVNPRASRTVPFVAKATGIAIAKIAARVMAGEKLSSFGLKKLTLNHVAVKEPVFPFNRFANVDVLLGPEMKSTGEVMGIDADFARAFAKAQIGASERLPLKGTVFVSVKTADKQAMVEPVRHMAAMGFTIMATRGSASFFRQNGIAVVAVNKVLEGRPHIVDAIIDGKVHLVFNTTEGAQSISDSFSIRRTALSRNVPCFTTVSAIWATVAAIAALRQGPLEVLPIQEYFKTVA